MRVDPDTCRDADLLAAEVRRLRAVIASATPTLTDAEREAVERAVAEFAGLADEFDALKDAKRAATLRGLLERTAKLSKSDNLG